MTSTCAKVDVFPSDKLGVMFSKTKHISSNVFYGGYIALASKKQPQVQFSAFPIIFLLTLLRFIGGTAESSGQRLDNVNRTHLVLASGKLVPQKFYSNICHKNFRSLIPLLKVQIGPNEENSIWLPIIDQHL